MLWCPVLGVPLMEWYIFIDIKAKINDKDGESWIKITMIENKLSFHACYKGDTDDFHKGLEILSDLTLTEYAPAESKPLDPNFVT